jgi:hypothetical protein
MLKEGDRRKLEQCRDALLAELRGLGNLMRGTIGEVGVKCGRPGSACAQGAKHRKVHLSVNLHGRTWGCYLGHEREALAAPLLRRRARLPLRLPRRRPDRGGAGPAGPGAHRPPVGADMTKDLHAVCAAVPPCGRFGANAAWYQLSLLTYNVPSALKSLALPSTLSAARPKRLR